MAIKLAGKDETIKVIARVDDSFEASDFEYENYLISLDESLLNLKSEPTRFIVRKVLPYAATKDIEAGRMKIDQETRQISVSTQTLDEARAILVGIENPPGVGANAIEFKKDSDGYAARELIASLATAGIVANIVQARGHANANNNTDQVKKK